MKRAGIVMLILALLAVWLIAFRTATVGADTPSVYSRKARGLAAVYAYLKKRGIEAIPWERPLAELPRTPGALILAAPFESPVGDSDESAIRSWLNRGGSIVLLTSGDEPELAESRLFEIFRVPAAVVPPPPPLGYLAWRRWCLRDLRLTRSPRAGEGIPGAAVVRAGSFRASPNAAARILLEDPAGAPSEFLMHRGKGLVLVVNNASMWANAWIAQEGNLDQVEASLRLAAPSRAPVIFDEWHHGHQVVPATERSTVIGPFELLVAHLLLIYGLALWTLSRPAGPRHGSLSGGAPSVERSLFSLAALHRRAGHATESARLLVASARQLLRDRDGAPAPPLPDAADEPQLLVLARRIGEMQRGGSRRP